ncbi:MAG: MFS transporter [Desulfopila sp.]
MSEPEPPQKFFHQPRAVWATAFACVVGFMSIGLVDPILTSIAQGLHASASQVSLLFTSYFLVTSVMMLVTGFVSSRLGGRKTLLLGAALIVVFSALAGTSDSVAQLVGFRAGWGLGNAFFVVTALSVIVATSSQGTMAAILMYEAALGLGLSAGPLLGAALGAHSWRYPFFGTASLMTIGFIAILLWLPELPRPKEKTSLNAPLKALAHTGLLTAAISAFFYNFAFFTILAFTPFVLQMSAHEVGLIFFGWGILLAIFSVLIAPRLQAHFSATQILTGCMIAIAALLLVMGASSARTIALCVILSGAVSGIANTVFTEIALEISDSPRPIASAGYNFVRWFAGVIAPFVAPKLADSHGPETSFSLAAAAALVSAAILFWRRSTLRHREAAQPLTALAKRPILVALAGDEHDAILLEQAAHLATEKDCPIELLHVRTWEVINDQAIDTESRRQANSLLEQAKSTLVKEHIDVTTQLVETASNLLPEHVMEKIKSLNPAVIFLGHRPERHIEHLQHGRLADLLNQQQDISYELRIVGSA